MTPIVSPWIFYAMSCVDTLKSIVGIIIFVSLLALGSAAIIKFTDLDYFPNEDTQKRTSNIIRKSLMVIVVSAIVVTFVPNGTTITKMLVAQNVTYERVDIATDTVEQVYEDIMELFESKDDSDA